MRDVQCLHCLGDYDLTEITVTLCSGSLTWVTPCCGRRVTDRYVEPDAGAKIVAVDGRTLA